MPITPIRDGDAVNAATINSRVAEINSDFEDIKDGTVALDSPEVTSFTNAEHSHENAAGGSGLRPEAIESASGDTDKVLTADGTSSSWEIAQGVPTGGLIPFAGAEAAVPDGFLICNGQAISRSTYSTLFTAIGLAYGTGNGSSTFNIPDLRGRFPLGIDNMGGSSANRVTDAQADSRGGSLGAEEETLTESQMPAHGHDAFIHDPGAAIGSSLTPADTWVTRANEPDPTTASWRFNNANESPGGSDNFSGLGRLVGGLEGSLLKSKGDDEAHSNIPPALSLNYIIKT